MSSARPRLTLRGSSNNWTPSWSKIIRSCKTSSRLRIKRFKQWPIQLISGRIMMSFLVKLRQFNVISKRCTHLLSEVLQHITTQQRPSPTKSRISGSHSWGKCVATVWSIQKSSLGPANPSWSSSTQTKLSNFVALSWVWPRTCLRYDFASQVDFGALWCERKALGFKTTKKKPKISNSLSRLTHRAVSLKFISIRTSVLVWYMASASSTIKASTWLTNSGTNSQQSVISCRIRLFGGSSRSHKATRLSAVSGQQMGSTSAVSAGSYGSRTLPLHKRLKLS